MALHGLWDTSIFIHEQSGGGVSLLGLLSWPAAVPGAGEAVPGGT
ncbi:MAG: hypothetical protein U0R23_04825 [Candidatus Nanopelagicales bacterium]